MIAALLILSVVLGALLGKRFSGRPFLAKNLLILSAGFLITICLNEVFPDVYGSGHPNIGVFVIVGVLLQMLLENLTKGFEHGHYHHQNDQHIFPPALMAGLFVHAFLEGIPLAAQREVLSPYLVGILFHNLPISFVIGAFLLRREKKNPLAWPIIGIFAMASPLGMWLGQYFSLQWQPYFLAVVGGIFLHISSVIIFESNQNHNVDWRKIGLVVCGVALALSGHLFHHHH